MTDCTDLTTPDTEQYCDKSGSAAVVYKNCVYLFGGQDAEGRCSDELVQYDINLRRFTRPALHERPAPRYNHAMCLLGERIYVYGGTDGRRVFDDLWCFDTAAGRFERMVYESGRQRPAPLHCHAMGALSGTELLIFGGYTDASLRFSSSYYVYNTSTNIMQAAPLGQAGPEAVAGASLTPLAGSLYLFGGCGLKGFVNELWAIGAARRWQQVRIQKGQPLGRAFHQLQPLGQDKLLLYGGQNGTQQNQKMADLWILAPGELSWRRLSEPKCDPRSHFAMAVWKSHSGNFRFLMFGGLGRLGALKNYCQILVQNYTEDAAEGENLLESKTVPITAASGITAQSSAAQPKSEPAAPDLGQSVVIQPRRIADLKLSGMGQSHKTMQITQEVGQRDERLIESQILDQMQQKLEKIIYQVNMQQDVVMSKFKQLDKRLEDVQRTAQPNDAASTEENGGIPYQILREIGKAKQELQLALQKTFNNNLLNTQQELIAFSKKLISDQSNQFHADVEMLTNNIATVNDKFDQFQTFANQQFIRESQISQFQPKIDHLDGLVKKLVEQAKVHEIFAEQQDKINQLVRNQIDDCAVANSLRGGVQAIIDEVTLGLRNKILKLETQIMRAETNAVPAAQGQPAATSNMNEQRGQGITVLNITDEAFEHKLVEIAQKKQIILNQNDVNFLIEDALKKHKNDMEEVYRLQIMNLKIDIEQKMGQKISQEITKAMKSWEKQYKDLAESVNALSREVHEIVNQDERIKQLSQQQVDVRQAIGLANDKIKLLNNEIMSIREELSQKFLQSCASKSYAENVEEMVAATKADCKDEEPAGKAVAAGSQTAPHKKQVHFDSSIRNDQDLSMQQLQNSAQSQVETSQSLPEPEKLRQSLEATRVNKIDDGLFESDLIRQNKFTQRLVFDEHNITENYVKFLSSDLQNGRIAYLDGQFCKIFDIATSSTDVTAPSFRVPLKQEDVSCMVCLGDYCYTGDGHGLLRQINIKSCQEILFSASQSTTAISTIFPFNSQSLNYLLSADENGQISIWDPKNNTFQIIGQSQHKVIAMSLLGELCVVADQGGSLTFYNLVTQQQVLQQSLPSAPNCMSIMNNVIVTGHDTQLCIYDLRNDKIDLARQISLEKRPNRCFLDQHIVILCTQDGAIQYYDTRNGELLSQVQIGNTRPLTEACICRGGVFCGVEAGCVNGIWYDE